VTVSVRVDDVLTSNWSAAEGSRVSLECSAGVANPPVIEGSTWWLKDGRIVQDGRRPLVIDGLDRTHAGRYSCSATNTLAPSGESPRNVTGTATVLLQVMCELNAGYIRLVRSFCFAAFTVAVQTMRQRCWIPESIRGLVSLVATGSGVDPS